MIQKINIAKCELFKDNGSYKTYAVYDTEGKRYGSTESFESGEIEVEVTVNGNYTNIKKVKPLSEKKFAPSKDWTFEKKKFAMETAIESFKLSNETLRDREYLVKIADYFYAWLNKNN